MLDLDKDTFETLNNFMDTSKRVIKEMPNNQALFQELTDYTSSYKELETEKRNIQYEVNRLKYKNDELQKENRKLKNYLHVILQSLKLFFHRLLKIGVEQDKDNVVNEITSYYDNDLYTSKDLHDIADDTSKEDEINDYIYNKNYEYEDDGIDI